MKSIYRSLCMITLSAALFSTIAGCTQEQATASFGDPPPPEVTVSHPMEKGIESFAHFTGTTEASESVKIQARVEGTLMKIHFTPGTIIKKGQLLYTIDSALFLARLEESEADLKIKKAALELAVSTSRKRENAFKDKAVSEVAVIQAKAELASAKAGVAAARAAVKRARLDLSYTRITAPITGRISRSLVDAGNLVGNDERTHLATIVKNDPLYVYFTVSERELLQYILRPGLQPSPAIGETPFYLGLSNQSGYPYKGRIDYMANRIGKQTGTIRIRGIISNPDHRLIPGLFAKIRVPVSGVKDRLLVPDTALSRDQQGHFLYLVDTQNIVRYQPVTTGLLANGGMRVISTGVKPGDQVIVKGIQKVRPGTKVTLSKSPPSQNNDAGFKPAA